MRQIQPVKECPTCGVETIVTDSRPRTWGIWRRRECPKCKARFTSAEIDYEAFMVMDKKAERAIRAMNTIKKLAKEIEVYEEKQFEED